MDEINIPIRGINSKSKEKKYKNILKNWKDTHYDHFTYKNGTLTLFYKDLDRLTISWVIPSYSLILIVVIVYAFYLGLLTGFLITLFSILFVLFKCNPMPHYKEMTAGDLTTYKEWILPDLNYNKVIKVDSMTDSSIYEVNLGKYTCTCPNFEERQLSNQKGVQNLCKHIGKAVIENMGNSFLIKVNAFEFSIFESISMKVRQNKYIKVGEVPLFVIGYGTGNWVNIFNNEAKTNNRSHRSFYGYNLIEKRWAFNEFPDNKNLIAEWIECNMEIFYEDIDLENSSNNISIDLSDVTSKTIDEVKNNHKLKPTKEVHALEGSFDESYFYDNEGNFKFPKYKNRKNALVKIKDQVDYNNEYWEYLEKEEKREYDLKDFEKDFFGPEFDVEVFEDVVFKIISKKFKKYKYLERYKDFFSILVEQVEENINDKYRSSQLILEKDLYDSDLVKLEKIESNDCEFIADFFTTKQLRRFAILHDTRKTGKKSAIINSLLQKDWNPQLILVSASENFKIFYKELCDLYIEDIEESIVDFHPLYHELWGDIEENYSYNHIDQRIKEKYNSKYWEKNLTI